MQHEPLEFQGLNQSPDDRGSLRTCTVLFLLQAMWPLLPGRQNTLYSNLGVSQCGDYPQTEGGHTHGS